MTGQKEFLGVNKSGRTFQALKDVSFQLYPQLGTDKFISRLSIFDALMNIGWKSIQNLLEVGT